MVKKSQTAVKESAAFAASDTVVFSPGSRALEPSRVREEPEPETVSGKI